MPGLEHIDGELREKFRDLFAPHRHHAGGAHDQMRLAGNRAGREQGQHLDGFAESHFVGEQAVTADIAEMVHPLDSTELIRTQQLGQHGRCQRGREHALAPRLNLRGQREPEARVAKQRKNQIRRERPLLRCIGTLRLLHIFLPRVKRRPFLRRERDDADAGQEDRLAVAFQHRINLRVREQPFAGAEYPPQIERRMFAVSTGCSGFQRRALRDGFDFDRARALEEIRRFLVELDQKQPFPGRQHGPQKIRHLDQ